jgi:glutamate synthase domain-containing protein 2
MAYELCKRLAQRGLKVPDIAFAGGFSSEDHVFKALALGAPYCKAVCMGRALMIPGMVGKNAEKWLRGEDEGLPKTVSRYGMTKEEIFMNYEVLKEKFGAEADQFPLGAIGIYNATDKLRVGLQQLMAGTRNWAVKHISRQDLFSLTEECAKVTSIPYVMAAFRDEALAIIDA